MQNLQDKSAAFDALKMEASKYKEKSALKEDQLRKEGMTINLLRCFLRDIRLLNCLFGTNLILSRIAMCSTI